MSGMTSEWPEGAGWSGRTQPWVKRLPRSHLQRQNRAAESRFLCWTSSPILQCAPEVVMVAGPCSTSRAGPAINPTWAPNGGRKLWSRARRNLGLEVWLEMSNADFSRGYGVQPQPCVVVRNRAWKRRARVMMKLARHSALGRMTFQSLEGVVYGPDGTPLADALVRLPGIHRSTRTGQYGEFKFEPAPRFGVKELIVEACGRELVIDVLSVPWPLAIHFQIDE